MGLVYQPAVKKASSPYLKILKKKVTHFEKIKNEKVKKLKN